MCEKLKDRIVSLHHVKESLTLLSWWIAIAVIPVSSRLALYVCNKTSLSPNLFTTGSFLLRFATAVLFAQAEAAYYIAGAVLFYLATVLDAVDGPVARLTGQESSFGRYYDHVSDLVGDFTILVGLALGQGKLFEPLIVSMLFMHIAESYISYLTNMAIGRKREEPAPGEVSIPMINTYIRYRNMFFRRNLKSFFSFPDYTAVVFVFAPLLGFPAAGLQAGFYFLLVIVCYTVFSTFVSLHTGERRFP